MSASKTSESSSKSSTGKYEIGTYFGITFEGDGAPKGEIDFMEISGLDIGVSVESMNQGALFSGPAMVRNRIQPGHVELLKGTGKISDSFTTWVVDSLNPEKPLQRCKAKINVYPSSKGSGALRTYVLHNAFPYRWTGPTLSTEAHYITVDRLSLAFERMTRDDKDETAQIVFPSLENSKNSEKVIFPAQPRMLSIHQGGEYGVLAGPGMKRPRPDFQHMRQRVLRAEICVDWDLGGDQLKDKKNVYQQTDKLQSFLRADEKSMEPPILAFKYGSREFEGYLTDLDVTIQKFSADGIPLRVLYHFNLMEAFNAKEANDDRVF